MEQIKGYKVFDPEWKCRGFQFEVGKTFEEDVEPSCCNRGFHFCKELNDCFNYYDFDPNNKVAEVIALGDIDEQGGDSKICTNKIQIVRELTWDEVLSILNTGKGNTGRFNTGNRNTGDCNTGDCNTGDCNTGGWNTGDCNTGGWNTGDCNTGDWNTGGWNTGGCNTGGCNTGDCNTGDWNTGDRNTGNRNTGDWNTGDRNTGDWNTGGWNTGDWNKSNHSTGVFNTKETKILMFNKPSDWTYNDWLNSDARCILNQIPKQVTEWIFSTDMTDEEKAAHPEHETAGGYLKVLDESGNPQKWWDELSDKRKKVITDLPNFDAAIFEEITGVKI